MGSQYWLLVLLKIAVLGMSYNNNNNFISIALLSYVQGALQSLLKNIYKFTTISYYIYNG